MKPGDIFVWYTDGVVEARGAAGAPFGLPALSAAVQKHRALAAEKLRDAVLAEVQAHTGGAAGDDMTLVVAELASPPPVAGP